MQAVREELLGHLACARVGFGAEGEKDGDAEGGGD